MIKAHEIISSLLLLLSLLPSAANASISSPPEFSNEEDIRRPGILQIGEHITTHISSSNADSELAPAIIQDGEYSYKKTYSLTHSGASYISLHFASMELDESCKMEIGSADDEQKYEMVGRGRHNQGMFWARHINGDSIKIDLSCEDWSRKAIFEIDEYVAGLPSEDSNRNLRGQTASSPFAPLEGRDGRDLTLCGSNDMRNAQCYASGEFSTEYNTAKPVAKIIIQGSGVCTGWLVEGNILITAEHCIQNTQQAMNAEYIFNYETQGGKDCSRSGVKDGSSTEVNYEAAELLTSVFMDDYALIRLSGNPGATHGFLEIEDRLPSIGEEIYIPQHPDGRDKEIAIFDSFLGGNRRCEIETRFQESCYGRRNTGYYDLSYSCDTEGGSSGAPVISAISHKVVGMHHCGGGCSIGNVAVPMTFILSDISSFLTLHLEGAITPTSSPPESPTASPTVKDSNSPTESPTSAPTVKDSNSPTESPTASPTVKDSNSPTASPTIEDSSHPTVSPSSSPTDAPTPSPTAGPKIDSDALLVSSAKAFNFMGSGYCVDAEGETYDKGRSNGPYSAEECSERCLKADDSDLRGFSYYPGFRRCSCFYDNHSEVIATCQGAYFQKCVSNKAGTGPVVGTSTDRQGWECHGYQ